MRIIAGERICRGDWVTIGDDGKAYRCKFKDEGAEFEGSVPAIAEKEKRGKRVKIPPSEIYVQELTSNVELNIPSVN